MSKHFAKVCEICLQEIPEDNVACTSKSLQYEDRKPVICSRCSYDFTSQSLTIKTEKVSIKHEVQEDIKPLKLEEINIHNSKFTEVPCQSNLLHCLDCDYSTVSNRMFIEHVKTHKDKTQHTHKKSFKYNACDYSSSQSFNLKHYIIRQSGEKPYKCRVCDYSCTNSYSLKRHIYVHMGEKPYKCRVCNHTFVRRSSLNQHVLKHIDEKPYKCKVCDYSCTSTYSLKRHIYVHTGVKPYECKICNSTFVRCSDLKRHMYKHTGEKPYKCKVCDYSGTRSEYLQRHMKNTHPNERSCL